ncbi:hypothetical protein, partial [Bradyrhizobium aeschynomenes]|uniref:hypothetical protein n=1 Tax=Bradyrhizobium aeschynomenes TaxID=2734909 RepID=UPI001AEDD3FB
ADGLLGRRASLVRSVGVHSALNHCLATVFATAVPAPIGTENNHVLKEMKRDSPTTEACCKPDIGILRKIR